MVAQKILSSYAKSVCIFDEMLYVFVSPSTWNDFAQIIVPRSVIDNNRNVDGRKNGSVWLGPAALLNTRADVNRTMQKYNTRAASRLAAPA